MEYTAKQLEQITQLSERLTPPSEISVLLGLRSEREFLEDIKTPDNAARIALLSGLHKTMDRIRQRNIQLANACSPAAIEQCCEYARNIIKEI